MKTFWMLAGAGLVLGVTMFQARAIAVTPSMASAIRGTTATSTPTHIRPILPVTGGYGSDYNNIGPDTATTPIQGIDYGIARIIRAESEAMLAGSQAALTMTDVQSRRMDNWRKWVETYYDVHRIARELRAAERGLPLTEADYVRMAQMGKPRRLTPSEVEMSTGELTWPRVLQADAFSPYRDILNQNFSDRAFYGVLDLNSYMVAERTTQTMLDVLKEHIVEFAPVDYMGAKRFLESLAYEARLPADRGAAAVAHSERTVRR